MCSRVVTSVGSEPGMGGGGNTLATARRAPVGAGAGGAQEALSSPAATRRLHRPAGIASSASSSRPLPSFAAGQHPHRQTSFRGGDGWVPVAVDGIQEDDSAAGYRFSDRFLLFGLVPSEEEVVDAVSSIQQVFVPVTFSQTVEDGSSSLDKSIADKTTLIDTTHGGPSYESKSNWMEPFMQVLRDNTILSQAREKVLDAFRLLRVNPSIQRMVVSLSTDTAVWDAVMKNEAVQEMRDSFAAGIKRRPNFGEPPNNVTSILSWILDNTKAKIIELIDKIIMIVNELFHPSEKERKIDLLEDAVGSSFLLSIMVFIVVIITRIYEADHLWT